MKIFLTLGKKNWIKSFFFYSNHLWKVPNNFLWRKFVEFCSLHKNLSLTQKTKFVLAKICSPIRRSEKLRCTTKIKWKFLNILKKFFLKSKQKQTVSRFKWIGILAIAGKTSSFLKNVPKVNLRLLRLPSNKLQEKRF